MHRAQFAHTGATVAEVVRPTEASVVPGPRSAYCATSSATARSAHVTARRNRSRRRQSIGGIQPPHPRRLHGRAGNPPQRRPWSAPALTNAVATSGPVSHRITRGDRILRPGSDQLAAPCPTVGHEPHRTTSAAIVRLVPAAAVGATRRGQPGPARRAGSQRAGAVPPAPGPRPQDGSRADKYPCLRCVARSARSPDDRPAPHAEACCTARGRETTDSMTSARSGDAVLEPSATANGSATVGHEVHSAARPPRVRQSRRSAARTHRLLH